MGLCPSAVFHKERQYADEEFLLEEQGFSVCEAAFEYQPRRSEETVLYRVVAENLESFLARQQERGRVGPPSDAEVARVADRVHRRVMRLMKRRDIDPEADPEEADPLRRDELLLAELYSASVAGRVATGPRAGRRIVRVGIEPDFKGAKAKSGRCCADAIQKILTCLGLPSRAPPITPAKPDDEWMLF